MNSIHPSHCKDNTKNHWLKENNRLCTPNRYGYQSKLSTHQFEYIMSKSQWRYFYNSHLNMQCKLLNLGSMRIPQVLIGKFCRCLYHFRGSKQLCILSTVKLKNIQRNRSRMFDTIDIYLLRSENIQFHIMCRLQKKYTKCILTCNYRSSSSVERIRNTWYYS